MFSTYESDVVGFDSNWERSVDVRQNESQTNASFASERRTSTNCDESVSIQTDDAEIFIPDDDLPEAISKRLCALAPSVLEELRKDDVSAFKNYDPARQNDFLPSVQISRIQILRMPNLSDQSRDPLKNSLQKVIDAKAFPVVALSWNSSNSMLAAAGGFLYHNSWCEHEATVNVFYKRRFNDEYELIHEVKLSSCASSVAFHPSEPAVLAVSTFNGGLSIWNLQHLQDGSNQDALLASVTSSHSGKTVSCIRWLNGKQINKYFPRIFTENSKRMLISGGSDNKINIWTVDLISCNVIKVISFEVKSCPDLCCIDFCQIWGKNLNISTLDREHAEDLFVVGSKTGDIIICKTTLGSNLKTDADPSIGNLQPHNAAILSLKFCPVKANILLSLGADKELRVYNILADAPIQIIFLENEYSLADWLGSSGSLILTTLTEMSKTTIPGLKVFDLIKKRKIAMDDIKKDKEQESNVSVSTFTLNNNRVAGGDMQGNITIWSVGVSSEVLQTNKM